MDTYFNLRYEFDHKEVVKAIDRQLCKTGASYICVADGVVLNIANRKREYLQDVNGGMFSICDSSYVPLYIKWIYGRKFTQYSGSNLFADIFAAGKYNMAFLGSSQNVLNAMRDKLMQSNPNVKNMLFQELPFCDIGSFDYPTIAKTINKTGPDIVWISLGAPKQEQFMARLAPHLNRGVLISVGAVFKFVSGNMERRAPQWWIEHHLEFVYRLANEPRKQFRRCAWILATLPILLIKEWLRKIGGGAN